MPSLAEVRAQLTGPGGMFEVVTEDVGGRPLQVYAQRMRSLREIAQGAMARGDDTFLAYGDRVTIRESLDGGVTWRALYMPHLADPTWLVGQ